ncbi:TPA: hypothetical protein ACGL02_000884 [Streptococcus agalactiae]|uniref:hypothetical protein n=1 Tax=Finegoldia magna TaxID=1260 RepID=UPI001C13E798|nr:hypothetical protein [Finegoldia magna]MCC2716647.1 hypothetical protein [Finegoldia magna]HBG8283037.1 hypothetical protein [Clostridioides difficile]HEN9071715.1 hypothetical protein [Streptococcus agalactiae]
MNNDIKKFIRELLKDYSNCEAFSDETNLFDIIPVYDLLYILNPIEKKYLVDFSQIILDNDYNIMTIENLSNEIDKKINYDSSFNR